MVGRIVPVERGRGRVFPSDLEGIPLLAAPVPLSGTLARREKAVKRAARRLLARGVSRTLAPPDFPWWSVLKGEGLSPVDPEDLIQSMAVPLALSHLERRGIPAAAAAVRVTGDQVTTRLERAVVELCAAVRYVSLTVPAGGQALARRLALEYGVALLPEGADTTLTLAFSPYTSKIGERTLHLWGGRPELGGLTLDRRDGGLPADCDKLSLLALLWECGRINRGDLAIIGAETT